MDAQPTVSAGEFYSQRLKRWKSHYLVWRVKSVSNTAMDMPHAQLINVRDPFETRTISCRTLANAAFYERLESRGSDRPAAAVKAREPKQVQSKAEKAGTGRRT